jgi:PST family polysaccharide transporter
MVYFLSEKVVTLVFTDKYFESAILFKWIIPVLIFSFPSMLYGWPCFGAIDNEKIYTLTTFIGVISQVIGIVLLVVFDSFTLVNLAVLRGVSEFVLCGARVGFVYKNKEKFKRS